MRICTVNFSWWEISCFALKKLTVPTCISLRHKLQMVIFCLNTIALNSHGDIRERYLPEMLLSILTTIADKNVASIDCQLLVRLLIVAKAILNEISQSAVIIEAGGSFLFLSYTNWKIVVF